MHLPTFTLLIVEDLATDRELYRRALNQDSSCIYHLLEAESVAGGLKLCCTESIDAILLDHGLPDGDGMTFLTALNNQSNISNPPVVMVTGRGDEKVAVRAMKLGVQDYLVKYDLTPELLRSTMRSAIENTRLRMQLQHSQEQAQLLLQAKNQQIMTIWESMTDAYIAVDRDWLVIYANRAATQIICQLTNLKPEGFLGRSHWDLFPALLGGDTEREYRRALDERVTVHLEIWFEPTGSWFETHLYPAAEGLGIYFRDITERQAALHERKQAETALQIGAELFRSTFANTSIGLAHVSLDGTWIRVNQKICDILGYSSAELLATTFQAITEPADLAEDLDLVQQLVNGEINEYTLEKRYIHKQGHHVWANLTVTLIRTIATDGRLGIPQYFISAIQDITGRKHAERELKESEERLQTGIAVAGIGLARFDYTTNLVALSPEAASLYGFSADTTFVTREQIHDTFHPDERTALEATIAQVINPDGTGWFAQDHRVVWPSGEVRWLSVRKQIFFDRSGAVARPSYAILAAIDITDRNQTLADLEARNQELDSFVYVVSHDLKAPLRAVANLSEWIEEDLAGSLTVANQEQMTLLRSRIYRMQSTIDGLLDYARSGRTDCINEPVDVAQLLAEMIESISPPPTFTISVAQNLPTLDTKRLLLSQVFTNLIGNGIKHHDRVDGSIHIAAAECGNFYEFAIADDGPGIALEHQDRMFKIFQAVNPQNRSDSTGIGLAIVKKIIEAEGGTIRLESLVGKGTTFYFTWPMALK
jgi:PAS domain S-box-containing protein